jgi:predicted nucleic acid-binding protein
VLVIDACIATKFIVAEPGQAEALARVRNEQSLVAPDWVLIEVGHALWRKTRAGEIDRATAEAAASALPQFFEKLVASVELAKRSLSLAFELDHWVYDCLYLAAALDLDAPLLTADRKFWNAAKRAGFERRVELLTWTGQAE